MSISIWESLAALMWPVQDSESQINARHNGMFAVVKAC